MGKLQVTRRIFVGAAAASFALQALPSSAAASHYTLDPAKSALEFSFVQAGAANKARFKNFAVSFDFAADDLASSHLDVTVEMSSADSADKDRDDTLKGSDLLDVAKYPQARFTAVQITKTADGFDAAGKLTIRGVTKDAHVPFTFRTTTEQGQSVGYMTGKTTIKRLDFGVGQGDWKTTEWIANDVTVIYTLRLSAH